MRDEACERKENGGGEWRPLSACEERLLRRIEKRIEKAERVVVATEQCAHGERYSDLRVRAVFEDFFVIKIDDEEFVFKIESDEDFERADEIEERIHEKVVDVVAKRVENEYSDIEWDGACDFGCCLFFKSDDKRFRVRFADFNDINTTHYKANSAIYTLKSFSVTEE